MFDYACITSIHDYLKQRFPGAFIRGFAGAISRFGDAHVFEIGEADEGATLTVAHRFLVTCKDSIERHFDEKDVPERLRSEGWVVVRGDGVVEAFDRGRVRTYAKSVGLHGRPAQRAS
jgi:hypothetical protein